MSMSPEPQNEHRWLSRLVGRWAGEMECVMAPGEAPTKSLFKETVRAVGPFWTMGEGESDGPDGCQMTSYMTLGYDPQKKRFVGTFIASVMTQLWIYHGTLDADQRILTLDTEGPSFSGEGLVPYQDIIEFIDDDHRTLASQCRGPDGEWVRFMTGHYHRVK